MMDRDNEDPDELMDRLTDRLIEIERGRLLRRRLKLFLISLLIMLVVVAGVLACWQYKDDLMKIFPPTQLSGPSSNVSANDC